MMMTKPIVRILMLIMIREMSKKINIFISSLLFLSLSVFLLFSFRSFFLYNEHR